MPPISCLRDSLYILKRACAHCYQEKGNEGFDRPLPLQKSRNFPTDQIQSLVSSTERHSHFERQGIN